MNNNNNENERIGVNANIFCCKKGVIKRLQSMILQSMISPESVFVRISQHLLWFAIFWYPFVCKQRKIDAIHRPKDTKYKQNKEASKQWRIHCTEFITELVMMFGSTEKPKLKTTKKRPK